MKTIRLLGLSALLALLCLAGSAAGQDGDAKLHSISYPELGKLVRSHKGKPVVVYVWHYTCGPCRAKGFPFLKRMHEQHAKEGLVILTVTVDPDKDKTVRDDYREKTTKFLATARPPFAAYDLDYDRARPPTALTFENGPPRVFVFNRDNQHVLRAEGAKYEDLEKVIGEVVKKK